MTARYELFPKQAEALDAVAACWESGMNRLLVKAPTGTGKTVTFARMLTHLARAPADDAEHQDGLAATDASDRAPRGVT